jgi:hypothetical protein
MKKVRRFLRTQRLSILAALAVALAAGLTAFASSAGANFTLSTGALKLTNGNTKGAPPESGSWVELLNKTPGGEPFLNPASTAENHFLTLINGSAAEGLLFGKAQPTGGIFGALTYFGETTTKDLFSALTLPGSDPLLVFSGTDTETGTRVLLGGNLLGLDIQYAGGLYRVGTLFGATGGDISQALLGTITGNALQTGKATIVLNWSTGLLEPGFSSYNALFHWEGTYIP